LSHEPGAACFANHLGYITPDGSTRSCSTATAPDKQQKIRWCCNLARRNARSSQGSVKSAKLLAEELRCHSAIPIPSASESRIAALGLLSGTMAKVARDFSVRQTEVASF
jgi:hypothetical protein